MICWEEKIKGFKCESQDNVLFSSDNKDSFVVLRVILLFSESIHSFILIWYFFFILVTSIFSRQCKSHAWFIFCLTHPCLFDLFPWSHEWSLMKCKSNKFISVLEILNSLSLNTEWNPLFVVLSILLSLPLIPTDSMLINKLDTTVS